MQLISHKLFYEIYREKLALVFRGVKNKEKIVAVGRKCCWWFRRAIGQLKWIRWQFFWRFVYTTLGFLSQKTLYSGQHINHPNVSKFHNGTWTFSQRNIVENRSNKFDVLPTVHNFYYGINTEIVSIQSLTIVSMSSLNHITYLWQKVDEWIK